MMGSVASTFVRTATSDSWAQLDRGPALRRIFGGYGKQDMWAVQRRYKQMDDGNGYISYEELQRLVGAEEFNLLFLWDLFSQQNELMDVTELLTVVCLFSSSRLEEKGRFLFTIFDESNCGVSTAREMAQLCFVMLGVLSRCVGTPPAKVKELSLSLRQELFDLLPEYQQAVHHVGAEAAFNWERVIHHSDVEHIIAPVKAAYERLPVAQPPPEGCAAPPALTWGINAVEQGPSDGPSKPKAKAVAPLKSREVGAAPALRVNEEPHLLWMRKLEDEPNRAGGIQSKAAKAAKSWLMMHSTDFAVVAKDLGGFRRLFARAVSTAVGVALACVEVVNVTPGLSAGSTLVEFNVHPPGNGDARGVSTLVLLLEKQLSSPHSALRKGALAAYLGEAQLLVGEPRRAGTPLQPEGRKVETKEEGAQSEPLTLFLAPWGVKRPKAMASDATEADLQRRVVAALRMLEATKRRRAKVEAAQVAALEVLREKEELLARLQTEGGAELH